MDRIDILFVYMDEESFAVKIDIKEFPAIVLFRNGDPLRFEGNIENEMAVLKVLNLFYALDVVLYYIYVIALMNFPIIYSFLFLVCNRPQQPVVTRKD